MNRDFDQACLELAVADLINLSPLQRRRALAHFQSIDVALAERLQFELLLQIKAPCF